MKKALILTGAGLDSLLVIKLCEQINIAKEVVHFDIGITYNKPIVAGQRISKYFGLEDLVKNGIEITRIDIAKEFYSYMLNIKNFDGYNGCLEYKVFLQQKAKQYMIESGADFIITGDVIDQKPLIQSPKSLKCVDERSQLTHQIYRPLSAVFFDNESLYRECAELKNISYDFVGNDNRRDLLARQLNIEYTIKKQISIDDKYEREMGQKAFQIFEKHQNYQLSHLNKIGLHYQLPSGARIVMGRTPFESEYLKNFYENLKLKYLAFSVNDPRFIFGFIMISKDLAEEKSIAIDIISEIIDNNKTDIFIYDNDNTLLGIKSVSSQKVNYDDYILRANDIFCPIISLNKIDGV